MAAAGRGSMIGFASVRAVTTEPGQGAYAATKAATVMLFRTLAAELGSSGVRANVIAPGVVETPLTQPIQDDAAWYQAYADKPILRRWASADEMVGAAVFLASDASSYVTGTTLFVDGGWTAADGRYDPPSDALRVLRPWSHDDVTEVPSTVDALVEFTRELVRIPSVYDPARGLNEQPAAELVEAADAGVRLVAARRPRRRRTAQRDRHDRRRPARAGRCCSRATPTSSPRATSTPGPSTRSAPSCATDGSTDAARPT